MLLATYVYQSVYRAYVTLDCDHRVVEWVMLGSPIEGVLPTLSSSAVLAGPHTGWAE